MSYVCVLCVFSVGSVYHVCLTLCARFSVGFVHAVLFFSLWYTCFVCVLHVLFMCLLLVFIWVLCVGVLCVLSVFF